MSTRKTTIISFLFLALSSCKTEPNVFFVEQLEIRNYNYIPHYFFDNTPFTGIVVEKEIINDKIVKYSVNNGVKNGTYTEIINKEILLVEANYKNGKLDGKYTSYFPTGIIQEQKKYVNGFVDGKRRYNWPNGSAKEINTFRNGVLTDDTFFYFPNGQLQKKIYYSERGRKDSIWLEYYNNGSLKDSTEYNNGKLIKRFQYDREGKKVL